MQIEYAILNMNMRAGRPTASVVEQMRVRVVEVGKRYERGEGGGVT